MKKVETIAILGAGNGGVTAAADLTSRGFKVRLYEAPEFYSHLETIEAKGGATFFYEGQENFQKFELISNDIKAVINGADIIMLTIPGFATETFAEILAPVVDESQTIFFNGSAAMSCVRFANKAKEMGINKNFKLAETNSLTYAARANYEKAEAHLFLMVKKLYFAALPAKNTNELLEKCKQIYNCLVPAKNVFETTLSNGNPEIHPGPTLLNAGRIDYCKGDFWLYKEGMTEHTVNIIKGIQDERLALGKALGFDLENCTNARFARGYFNKNDGNTMHELFNNSKVYKPVKGPFSVDSRYITEDIADGLVLWSDLGKALFVKTPIMDAVITLCACLLQRDFTNDGITLEKLGLNNMSTNELIEHVS